MAFPTIPTVANGRLLIANQTNTTATRTFPSFSSLTFNQGDLIIALIASYQNSVNTGAYSSWGAGLTEFTDQTTTASSTMSIGGAWKVATGTETGTFTVLQGGTITGNASMILMAIPGAYGQAPQVTTIVNGTASMAAPGTITPSWGADDTLFIAVGSNGETSATGSWTAMNGPPTNYTSYQGTNPVDNSLVGETGLAVAFRQLHATSDTIGAFTGDTSNARNSALALAIRPAQVIAKTQTAVARITATVTKTQSAIAKVMGPSTKYYLLDAAWSGNSIGPGVGEKMDSTASIDPGGDDDHSAGSAPGSSQIARTASGIGEVLMRRFVLGTLTGSSTLSSGDQYSIEWGQSGGNASLPARISFALGVYRDGTGYVATLYNSAHNSSGADGQTTSGTQTPVSAVLTTSAGYATPASGDTLVLEVYENVGSGNAPTFCYNGTTEQSSTSEAAYIRIPDSVGLASGASMTNAQTAVARISKSVSIAQGATARVSRVGMTSAQTAAARISKSFSKTQSAVSRISSAGLTRAQTAVARISVVGMTKAQSVTARVQVAGLTRTQPATARIQRTLAKTQSAVANIAAGNVVTKTQGALARIQVVGLTKAQASVARISKSFAFTQPAVARVSNAVAKTQSAVARVSNTGMTRAQSATARVSNSAMTKTQGAVARVQKSFTKTQASVARIQRTFTSTQAAAARVSVTGLTRTQSAVARVSVTGLTRAQSAAARISRALTKTQSAVANIAVAGAVTKTQTATARIQRVGLSVTQTASARIAIVGAKTQGALARISNAGMTRTQGATARISRAGLTATQAAVARVQKGFAKTQASTARISAPFTRTQAAVARIAKTNTLTQPAAARIARAFAKAQAATARVSASRQAAQTASARIRRVGVAKTQLAGARIARSFSKTQSAAASILRLVVHIGDSFGTRPRVPGFRAKGGSSQKSKPGKNEYDRHGHGGNFD